MNPEPNKPTSKPSDSQEEALQRALRFLGYRPRSEAELRSFLVQRGHSAAITERTLEKLCSLNYLNDETFARNWAHSRAETCGYGPNRIEQELRTKGIDQALIKRLGLTRHDPRPNEWAQLVARMDAIEAALAERKQ